MKQSELLRSRMKKPLFDTKFFQREENLSYRYKLVMNEEASRTIRSAPLILWLFANQVLLLLCQMCQSTFERLLVSVYGQVTLDCN